MIARRTLWAILATWLLALSAWAQSPLKEVWKDVYAVPLAREDFTSQRGEVFPYRVHLHDSSYNPIPMDQATRSAAVQLLYAPGITAKVYAATLYAPDAIIHAEPVIDLLPGDYIFQGLVFEEPSHTLLMIGSEDNLTITPKPDISFGDMSFTNYNSFSAFVSNQVSMSLSNFFLINLTNNISVAGVYVTNGFAFYTFLTNYVDANVYIPGLSVDLTNMYLHISQIIADDFPSGSVVRVNGANRLYADTNFQASVLVRQGTNDLGYADTLSIGPGLMAGVSNGEASIELAGMNFPGAPGTILTNVIYYHSLGTKTAQWYQVAAGVTQIFVHANSGGASGAVGGADAGAVGRVTIPVEPFEWLSLYIAEAGFTQTNSTGAPEFTDQAWPGGGRGASRVINQKMHASAGYTAIFRGVADTNTYTNLLLVLAGAAGVGQYAGDLSGGNGGGVIGENGSGLGTGYTYGRGATETNHGASYFSNFIGLAITGSMPARLRGGDAQIATNYIGPAAGGSPGWYSGSSSVGYAAGHGSLSASAGSGNSWFNEAAGVRGEIASGKGVNGPPWTEDYYYRTAGVQWGKPGQPGGMWIAEIVEAP